MTRQRYTEDADEQLDLALPECHDAGSSTHWEPYVSSNDPRALSTVELLGTLLSPTPVERCRALHEQQGRSVKRLAQASPGELRALGFTARGIVKLRTFLELAKRYGEEEFVPGAPFRSSYDVYAHFRERLAEETVEHFIAVLLDNKHRKMTDVLVSLGSLTASVVHPRDVFGRVMRESAAAVIFVHNHPSGDPTPSREDLEITRRLREVGDLIGVRMLDHIVIGKGRYVSFVDDGYW